MTDFLHTDANGNIHAACYRCPHDHVHFEFANLTLTFTPQQFLAICELFRQVQQQLRVGTARWEEAEEVAVAVM